MNCSPNLIWALFCFCITTSLAELKAATQRSCTRRIPIDLNDDSSLREFINVIDGLVEGGNTISIDTYITTNDETTATFTMNTPTTIQETSIGWEDDRQDTRIINQDFVTSRVPWTTMISTTESKESTVATQTSTRTVIATDTTKPAADCYRDTTTPQSQQQNECFTGMKSRAIPNCAITASSYPNENKAPFHARLDNEECWNAKGDKVGEWLQVDFGGVKKISGVITQGRPNYERWVKTFKIEFGLDQQNLSSIEEKGYVKIFQGNYDRNTEVFNRFPDVISCRFIRIYPQTWYQRISMRVEFVFGSCFNDTAEWPFQCYMGLKSRAIRDSAITASSYFGSNSHHHHSRHGPFQARLDNPQTPDSTGSWSAQQNIIGQWLQVDFGSVRQISGVITQGRPNVDQWVKTFKIEFGLDQQNMSAVEEKGDVKIFQGNSDGNTKVFNRFPGVITCRFIRIYPQEWNSHISMRAEFVSGGCFNHTTAWPFLCYMGMKSGLILNSALAASSVWGNDYGPSEARLDNRPVGSVGGCWIAKPANVGQWIQVDFGSVKQVAGIITQGRTNFEQWVKTFKIAFGLTKHNMSTVQNDGSDKVFQGNADRDTKVYNRFPEVINCRFLRLYPQTWQSYISMRVEFVSGWCFNDTTSWDSTVL